MEQRGFKGVWIPREIWLDERLNALDKVILAEIDSLDNENGCIAGNEYLADFCQCSVTKVSTAVSKLKEFGLIRVESFDGRKRVLRSCLAKTESVPFKNCKAGMQNLKAINISNNRSIVPYEKDIKKDSVQAYASSNLLVVSPRAMEELNSFIDDLSEDIVRHAIDNALDAGVRTWNYVRSILNDYLTAGVKTVGEAIAHDEKRRAKNKPAPQDKPAKRKDWDEMTEEERKKALASGPFGKWVD